MFERKRPIEGMTGGIYNVPEAFTKRSAACEFMWKKMFILMKGSDKTNRAVWFICYLLSPSW